MREINIPRAPRDLWRRILTHVTKEPDTLHMSVWHGSWKEGPEPEVIRADTARARACSTTHCMAGWVTFLTPGGLKLEENIERRFLIEKPDDVLRDEYGLSEYVIRGCDDTTSMAALLILEKAGWADELDKRMFFRPRPEVLRLIKRLAKLEAKREESKSGRRARA